MATTNVTRLIADGLRPVRSESSDFPPTRADTLSLADGVFNARSRSRANFDRRSARTEFSHGDEADEWQHGHHKKQVFKGRTLLYPLNSVPPGMLHPSLIVAVLVVFFLTIINHTPARDKILQGFAGMMVRFVVAFLETLVAKTFALLLTAKPSPTFIVTVCLPLSAAAPLPNSTSSVDSNSPRPDSNNIDRTGITLIVLTALMVPFVISAAIRYPCYGHRDGQNRMPSQGHTTPSTVPSHGNAVTADSTSTRHLEAGEPPSSSGGADNTTQAALPSDTGNRASDISDSTSRSHGEMPAPSFSQDAVIVTQSESDSSAPGSIPPPRNHVSPASPDEAISSVVDSDRFPCEQPYDAYRNTPAPPISSVSYPGIQRQPNVEPNTVCAPSVGDPHGIELTDLRNAGPTPDYEQIRDTPREHHGDALEGVLVRPSIPRRSSASPFIANAMVTEMYVPDLIRPRTRSLP